MKLVVVSTTIVLAVALPAMANAQPAQKCAQVVQNINDLAAAIASGANSYWTHRKNFFELKSGPSSLVVPNAPQLADQEKTRADSLRAAMPSTLANFKALIATASSQKCRSPDQLSAFAEPIIKLAKGINFDQLQPDPRTEAPAAQTPPRMPALTLSR